MDETQSSSLYTKKTENVMDETQFPVQPQSVSHPLFFTKKTEDVALLHSLSRSGSSHPKTD